MSWRWSMLFAELNMKLTHKTCSQKYYCGTWHVYIYFVVIPAIELIRNCNLIKYLNCTMQNLIFMVFRNQLYREALTYHIASHRIASVILFRIFVKKLIKKDFGRRGGVGIYVYWYPSESWRKNRYFHIFISSKTILSIPRNNWDCIELNIKCRICFYLQ